MAKATGLHGVLSGKVPLADEDVSDNDDDSEQGGFEVTTPKGALGLRLRSQQGMWGVVVDSIAETSPLNGSLLAGDMILAIDGEDTTSRTLTQVHAMIQNGSDRERVLKVHRADSAEEFKSMFDAVKRLSVDVGSTLAATVMPTPLDDLLADEMEAEAMSIQDLKTLCGAAYSSESFMALEKHQLIAKAKVAQRRLREKRDDDACAAAAMWRNRAESDVAYSASDSPLSPTDRLRARTRSQETAGPMLDFGGPFGRPSARFSAGSTQDEPAEAVRDPGDADRPNQHYCDMNENQICTGGPCTVS